MSSQTGVQQGDPLGPMLFALVLHKLVSIIDADDGGLNLFLQTWYLDDGVLAGNHTAVLHALQLIEEMGLDLGLSINLAKCELFSPTVKSSFPSVLKSSCLPYLDILGPPIGDYLFCAHFMCAQAKKLLSVLLEMADSDLDVAILLLRICGGFCKLVHISRTTRFLQASPHFENHSP